MMSETMIQCLEFRLH